MDVMLTTAREIENIWQKHCPISNPEVPLHAHCEKDIKEKIFQIEFMTHASLDDCNPNCLIEELEEKINKRITDL